MTYTDPTPPPTPAAAPYATTWELCDHCQAPLAERQRYCVVCGARRVHADDPAARWFVVAARRARAADAAPAATGAETAPGSAARLRFALVFALLPLVAALGIVVGGGAAATGDTSGDAGGSSPNRGSGRSDPVNGKVIARTRYGSARSLTESSVTTQQIEESRRALQHIVESK